jgi:transcriptional regulator with XRE-family HTH domain
MLRTTVDRCVVLGREETSTFSFRLHPAARTSRRIVRRFGARLREVRLSRGMTQAQLAEKAQVTTTYIGRLEGGGAAPGIDLVERLATALATTVADLLPASDPPETMELLRSQTKGLVGTLLEKADRETLLMLNPMLARIVESLSKSR